MAIALGVTIAPRALNRLTNILVGKENIIPIPELILKMIASTVPRANFVPKKASANQVATAQLGTIVKQGRSSPPLVNAVLEIIVLLNQISQ